MVPEFEILSKEVLQTGAIGGVCMIAFAYIRFKDSVIAKIIKKKDEESKFAKEQIVEVLRETNKIDSDLTGKIAELSSKIDILISRT